MVEQHRNITQEAVNSVNRSDRIRKINREQFVTRWAFNIGILAGLYEIKDTIPNVVIDYITKLQVNDLKSFAIIEAIGAAVIGARIINHHFEKQKNAIRINSVNREIQEEYPDYNPVMLSERRLDQYKDSFRGLSMSFRRKFKI